APPQNVRSQLSGSFVLLPKKAVLLTVSAARLTFICLGLSSALTVSTFFQPAQALGSCLLSDNLWVIYGVIWPIVLLLASFSSSEAVVSKIVLTKRPNGSAYPVAQSAVVVTDTKIGAWYLEYFRLVAIRCSGAYRVASKAGFNSTTISPKRCAAPGPSSLSIS